MSRDWYADVLEFHETFGCAIGARPAPPDPATVELRAKLVAEEHEELKRAMAQEDLPGVADALADLVYVILGTAISYGMDLRPVWDEVQAANMRKVGGKNRPDGKVLKPAGWQPPDVAGILQRQGAVD